MADPVIPPISTGESDEEALALVRRDLEASDKFKRDFCPTEKVVNRRLAYEGDPEAYDFPYDADWGAKLVNNWMLRQINHKVGKLSRSPTRLNLRHRRGLDDDDTRLMLAAVQKRLIQKGREANWREGRRKLLLDAAKVGFGVRCIGLRYDRRGYIVCSWRVRAEEFHMDPAAEGPNDAEWMTWRRYVAGTKIPKTIQAHRDLKPQGAGGTLVSDSRGMDIALSDDRILMQGRGSSRGATPFVPDPYLVTDYYRKDQTQDYYYPCPGCGEMTGVSRMRDVQNPALITPVYRCARCGTQAKKAPELSSMRRAARYPYGRHIKIVGPGTVDYHGPSKMKLQDVFPFVFLAWYEGETWNGISEVQQLAAPALYNMIAMNMVADNAFSNAHPKVMVPKDGIESGWNNNPDDVLELSEGAWAQGGAKRLETGEVAPSVRILLDRSIQDLFLLAANSPESQGQAPETLRSGVGFRSVVAASEVGLFLTMEALTEADATFYRIVRDLCAMVDSPAEIPMVAPNGTPGNYSYDRSVLAHEGGCSPIDIEVLTDRDVDQEREELFSRAMEMKGLGVIGIDDEVLLRLSGIPEDVIGAARERARMQQAEQAASGMAPELGGGLGSPPGAAGPPSPSPNGGTLPPAIAARLGGQRAPRPTRPPVRSRGAMTAQTPTLGGGA